MSVTLVGDPQDDRLGELVPCLTLDWLSINIPLLQQGVLVPNLGGEGDRNGVLISSSRPRELLKLLLQRFPLFVCNLKIYFTSGSTWIFEVQTFLLRGLPCPAASWSYLAESPSSLSCPWKALPSPFLSSASSDSSSSPAWAGSSGLAFPSAKSPKLTWQHPLPFLYPSLLEPLPPTVPGVKSRRCWKWRLVIRRKGMLRVTCFQNWSGKASAPPLSPFWPPCLCLLTLASQGQPFPPLLAVMRSREGLPIQQYHVRQYCLSP